MKTQTKEPDDTDSRTNDCAQGGRQDTAVILPKQPIIIKMHSDICYSSKQHLKTHGAHTVAIKIMMC